MKLYSKGKNYELYQGNMLDMLQAVSPCSVDSIVTDPPYGLTSIVKRFGKPGSAECKQGTDGRFARLSKGFMGKEWDGSGIEYNPEAWAKCYEVLKPGGYLLAFGGSRTFYRIACAIEDAGFEIRDTIMWLYGSGFPKSMNIGLALDKKNGVESETVGLARSGSSSRAYQSEETTTAGEYEVKRAQNEWSGWGSALKPAFEPIIVARKPFKGSLIDNILKNGVGGLNIDECRVPFQSDKDYHITADKNQHGDFVTKPMTGNRVYGDYSMLQPKNYEATGRFPANVILTYGEDDAGEVCGGFPFTKSTGGSGETSIINNFKNVYGEYKNGIIPSHLGGLGDEGSAARYFYCAKASKKDRGEGLDEFETKQCVGGGGGIGDYLNDVNSCSGKYGSEKAPHKNTHPTVKPCELMQYLVRLVTPKGGTVLDPFNGSGSTGKATMYENKDRNAEYKYIGIELSEEYLAIAKARIEYVCGKDDEQSIGENHNGNECDQIDIFQFIPNCT